ncbi:hypothetical protein L3X38_038163 [Prunus dulcis]|uniref:Uncharacterized protein n=1 Tax=Prunus dulcis TaxID=3755 RepID=A0AAD4V4P5_PRUDU|nr:hypothetical protein L3X38_038163 [Prunus dulcis]
MQSFCSFSSYNYYPLEVSGINTFHEAQNLTISPDLSRTPALASTTSSPGARVVAARTWAPSCINGVVSGLGSYSAFALVYFLSFFLYTRPANPTKQTAPRTKPTIVPLFLLSSESVGCRLLRQAISDRSGSGHDDGACLHHTWRRAGPVVGGYSDGHAPPRRRSHDSHDLLLPMNLATSISKGMPTI